MPPRKINPLIATAKRLSADLDVFALAYDASSDKDSFMLCLGDTMELRKDNHALFCRMNYALGINQQVEEEAEEYIRLYHSNQNGIDKLRDQKRIFALINYLICKYIDVSLCYRYTSCTIFWFDLLVDISLSVYMVEIFANDFVQIYNYVTCLSLSL